MFFHRKFTRVVIAGPTTWNQDVLPVDGAGKPMAPDLSKTDNAISIYPANNVGWPAHRMAVGYSGPASAPTVAGSLYVFDKNTGLYFTTNPAAITLTSGQIGYFPLVCVAAMPQTLGNIPNAVGGGSDFVLILTPPSAGLQIGNYVFAMGPDLVIN